MSQFFSIHPETPQSRLINQAVDILSEGGVIAYPTDSAYALGCRLDNKAGAERIRQIRKLAEDHNFTLMCQDLSELSRYARVDNAAYRLIKHATPGPYTFIFEASKEVPRRLMSPKRKTIGLRVPDSDRAPPSASWGSHRCRSRRCSRVMTIRSAIRTTYARSSATLISCLTVAIAVWNRRRSLI